MATTENVRQVSESLNRSIEPIIPRHGVVTLFGYGIQVRVDRGHLVLDDGIGSSRRHGRFPRVGHGIRRLVIVGADGIVSLAALRWLCARDHGSRSLLGCQAASCAGSGSHIRSRFAHHT
jgi:hypothetical protein